jgi:hypothetical protein
MGNRILGDSQEMRPRPSEKRHAWRDSKRKNYAEGSSLFPVQFARQQGICRFARQSFFAVAPRLGDSADNMSCVVTALCVNAKCSVVGDKCVPLSGFVGIDPNCFHFGTPQWLFAA